MFQLLCRGPRFNHLQSNALTNDLYAMQTIFTETQLCIPLHFDLCKNLDRIWEFTYVKRPNEHIEWLDMSDIWPASTFAMPLNYFTGHILSDEYYVHGADDNEENYLLTLNQLEAKIKSGPFICLDGEQDLEKIMNGEFSPLRRTDCSLRFNEIFRWAWEGWRLAVGTRIGSIYPKAIHVMNIGAKQNGN